MQLLNNPILFYKALLQNRLFAFNWPFGRKNAPFLAFLKLTDNEIVMKAHCFPCQSIV
jgi:hypothetical protein